MPYEPHRWWGNEIPAGKSQIIFPAHERQAHIHLIFLCLALAPPFQKAVSLHLSKAKAQVFLSRRSGNESD